MYDNVVVISRLPSLPDPYRQRDCRLDTKKELEVGCKSNLLNGFPYIAVRSPPCHTGLGSFISLAQLAV